MREHVDSEIYTRVTLYRVREFGDYAEYTLPTLQLWPLNTVLLLCETRFHQFVCYDVFGVPCNEKSPISSSVASTMHDRSCSLIGSMHGFMPQKSSRGIQLVQ